MKPNREWLAADNYEEMASLGGSFDSDDITDYNLTPFDLGYGPFVRFGHEFVGRVALEAFAGRPLRAKVTLVFCLGAGRLLEIAKETSIPVRQASND